MGLFGFGDEKKDDGSASAGEQGWSESVSAALAQRLIDVGIAGIGPLSPASDGAQKTLVEEGSVDKAIDKVVERATGAATAGGFVTGLGGFLTMPVALPANVAEFYVLATRMTAQIAHLRGYDVSDPQVRSAVLLTLVGTESTAVLSTAGMAGAGRLASLATRGLSESALMLVNKAVAFRLIQRVGTKAFAKLGKFVPVVGGAVGAGLDRMLMKKIAKNAMTQFPVATGQITP